MKDTFKGELLSYLGLIAIFIACSRSIWMR